MEITGSPGDWELSVHGNHRFRGALGTQRAWKRNNPKHVALEYKEHNADEAECSEKIDEQMEIPFD